MPPSRTYHHGDLREALIQSAMTEVEVHGHQTITLGGLARANRVTQPAIYRHFTGRADLLSAVSERGFRAFQAAIEGAIESARPGFESVDVAHAYLGFARHRPHLYCLMFATQPAELLHGTDNAPAARASCAQLLASLRPPGSGEVGFAFGLWASLHGLATLEKERLLPSTLASQVDVDVILDNMLSQRAAPTARDSSSEQRRDREGLVRSRSRLLVGDDDMGPARGDPYEDLCDSHRGA